MGRGENVRHQMCQNFHGCTLFTGLWDWISSSRAYPALPCLPCNIATLLAIGMWLIQYSLHAILSVKLDFTSQMPCRTPHSTRKFIRISGKSVVLCRPFWSQRNLNNRLFDILFGFEQRHLVHIYPLNNEHQVIVVTKQGLLRSWLWQTQNKKCSVGHNSL